MQEAWEYIKEENFQMKGPEKEERKRIRTRTIEKKKERKECAYPCARICPHAGLRKTLILLDLAF